MRTGKHLGIKILVLVVLMIGMTASAMAKSANSEKADTVFFYGENGNGQSILLRVMPIDELKKQAHGQSDGMNYAYSGVDNFPTTQYCEAKGLTLDEMIAYVRTTSTVSGVKNLSFSGDDRLYLMATDSYGNYSRNYTYSQLCGEKRYYFEKLYDTSVGWKPSWEVAGEDNSKYGITLAEYNAKYKSKDSCYQNKREVFKSGAEMPVILATESRSGRTAIQTSASSSEPGLASYVTANGGIVAGSLKNVLSDDSALRLCIPMSEADLMAAHRSVYENFKWIYNLKLSAKSGASLVSQGTVAEAVPTFQLNGNKLTMTLRCATSGAAIYYGFQGAAQTLYTGPVTIDVAGRDLDSNPVTVYVTAIKEGYCDAGVQICKYPGMAPAFQTIYSGMTGQDLVFTAANGVSSADWSAWTKALGFITRKEPSAGGYTTLNKSDYSVDNNKKTITFKGSLFKEPGSESFIFHASLYADKSVSVTMKRKAPEIPAVSAGHGQAIVISVQDAEYLRGATVYAAAVGGDRTLVPSSYVDRTQSGKLVISKEYMEAASTVISGAGTYSLELVNNEYSPASQTVSLVITKAGTYTDVPSDAWYYTYVTELSASGVVNGMGNGLFQPQGTVTWGQALKLIMLAAGYEEQPADGEHWASGYLGRAVLDGLTSYSGNLNHTIDRLNFCKAAAKALKVKTTLTTSPFYDTQDTDVMALHELGIINGKGEGRFAPADTLTRAEISKIIWCIQNLKSE